MVGRKYAGETNSVLWEGRLEIDILGFGATILRSNIKVVATDRGLMYEDYVYPLVL